MKKCRDVHANETNNQDCVQVTLFPRFSDTDPVDTCCLYSKLSSNYSFKEGAISGPTRCGMFYIRDSSWGRLRKLIYQQKISLYLKCVIVTILSCLYYRVSRSGGCC